MYNNNAGKVGIGLTDMSTDDAIFQVNGSILAERVKVRPEIPIPDYVFEDTYPLRSLKELETYINTHKHLPEVPSAAEVEANGLYLDALSLKLLQKVEELTLYLIEQQKLLEEVNKQNQDLEQKVSQLEKQKN